jgi:hypothetical protein
VHAGRVAETPSLNLPGADRRPWSPSSVKRYRQDSLTGGVTDVPTIVYELALRSLDQQERELAELRSRTNTVIAAAALIASFLGAATIREYSGLDALGILALVVLVVTGGLSLYALWPRELRFAIDAQQVDVDKADETSFVFARVPTIAAEDCRPECSFWLSGERWVRRLG